MKIVITGCPCSGKTSIINEFERRGYCVLGEAAREVIYERRKYDATKSEWDLRQRIIFDRQIEREKNLEGLTFLDRSVIDSYAYFIFRHGQIPKSLEFPKTNYEKVFVLDRLSFEEDGLRSETPDELEIIHNLLIESYKKFGYEPTKVPLMPVKSRADFILNHLNLNEELIHFSHELKGGAK